MPKGIIKEIDIDRCVGSSCFMRLRAALFGARFLLKNLVCPVQCITSIETHTSILHFLRVKVHVQVCCFLNRKLIACGF
jgi:hypothetical protein